jgi:hypothetical protein
MATKPSTIGNKLPNPDSELVTETGIETDLGVVEQHNEIVGEPTTETPPVETPGDPTEESGHTPEELTKPTAPTEPVQIAMVALHSHNYLSSPGGNPTALRRGVSFVVYDADLAKEYEDSGEAVRAENFSSQA